jgi:TetR/AcrR family transcriptional repressor of nem operon
MTKAERTRQYIVEKTASLFNSKGYDGTSLADLTEATGLTKGALYGNFSGKDEIAEEAFRYAIEKVRMMVKAELENLPTCKQQLVALLEFYARYVIEPPVPGGCPLLNTAIEADDHRVSMRTIVAAELMSTVNFIADLLEKGIEKGEFQPAINAREIAYTFFCSVEGALMFSRAEKSPEPMDIIVRHCKNKLDQISK